MPRADKKGANELIGADLSAPAAPTAPAAPAAPTAPTAPAAGERRYRSRAGFVAGRFAGDFPCASLARCFCSF